ncbi:DUF2514 family protein [Burkholderia lata]|uniref:DUF2514 family protein n=1 Tax=Burkholderia lata (strain ATCC 17760 / DSM 23089 / LMG 22485 / NCIMB 9086 / R18194 / 383) TaxID=482957 RepID=UPI0034A00652
MARADAASAADGLRRQVSELVDRARGSASSSGGPATGDAIDLLADMFGRADARAAELAAIADEWAIAGRQCESDYNALTSATSR